MDPYELPLLNINIKASGSMQYILNIRYDIIAELLHKCLNYKVTVCYFSDCFIMHGMCCQGNHYV